MDIETAIRQKRSFTSNREKSCVNLMFTYAWLMGRSRAFFKPFGLTPQQYNILRILKGANKPLTTSVIRERLLNKMSDATRVLDRMITKKLVAKTTCSSDRRLVDVVITQDGMDLLDKVSKHAEYLNFEFCHLNEDEAGQLSNLLDKMRG